MTTEASGSRHSAGYVLEGVDGVNYGVTPATPAFKNIRHNSMTLALQKATFQSNEIRADRQIADFRSGAKSVTGNIVGELSNGSYDDLLEAVLCGTWAPRSVLTANTLSAMAADNSFNDSANGFVAAGFVVGDTVSVAGFTGNIANNIGSGVITALTAGKMTIGGTDGDVIVDDAAGEAVTITSLAKSLKAGVTRRSFTIERYFHDITQYLRYRGCEMDTLALSANSGALVGLTFGVMGQTADAPASVVIAGATYPAPLTTSPMDALTGVVKEGGAVSGIVTAVNLNVSNGLAARQTIGNGGLTLQPSIGRSNITGDVEMYFADAVAYNKFVNDTASSIEFSASDGVNTFDFYLPHIKYTAAPPDVSGEGSVTIKLPFQALLDPTTGSNIVVTRNS